MEEDRKPTSRLLAEAFGMRLRERRLERGMLQRELALAVLGKDDQTIVSRWENERVLPSPRKLRRIHEVLALSQDTLGTWRAAHDARQAEQAGL